MKTGGLFADKKIQQVYTFKYMFAFEFFKKGITNDDILSFGLLKVKKKNFLDIMF